MINYINKNQKGITLIALVITIIILLILAGISIATLTGSNGLLQKVADAKDINIRAEEEETIKVSYNGIKSNANQNEINANNIREELEKLGKDATVKYWKNGDIAIKFNDTNHVYTLEQEGVIEEKEEDYLQSKATFIAGPEMNVKMKTLAGIENPVCEGSNNTKDTVIKAIKFSETEPTDENKTEDNIVSTPESECPIYMWFDNGTIYWWSKETYPLMNYNSSRIFDACQGLEDVSGIANWNSENVIFMQSMFNMYDYIGKKGEGNLKDITAMKYWNTSRVMWMDGMFQYMTKLETVEVGNWNTGNVRKMEFMFAYCYALKNLDVYNWDTKNVTNMKYLFYCNYNLSTVNVSKWNTSKVTSMNRMFRSCPMNAEYVKDWDTSSCEDMSGMFLYLDAPKMDLSKWDTSKCKSMYRMFFDCSVRELWINKFDMSNLEAYDGMFQSVSTDCKIVTNQAAKEWLNEHFPAYTNIEVADN